MLVHFQKEKGTYFLEAKEERRVDIRSIDAKVLFTYKLSTSSS